MTAETRAKCLRFTAYDGTVVRMSVTYPGELIMSNDEIYVSPGVPDITDVTYTIDGSPSLADYSDIYHEDTFTRADLQSGKWQGATAHLFACDWTNPVEDAEPLCLFNVGKVTESDDKFVMELIGQMDKLNAPLGRVITSLCQKVFANTNLDGEPIYQNANYFCSVNAAANTVTGTLTSVTSATEFYDTARTEADDWFGNGQIIFTSGANAGLSRRAVSEYILSSGKIVVNHPFYYTPNIGDTYQMIAGCRKRWEEDCIAKFSNGTDYGGFPHVPSKSVVTQRGTK